MINKGAERATVVSDVSMVRGIAQFTLQSSFPCYRASLLREKGLTYQSALTKREGLNTFE